MSAASRSHSTEVASAKARIADELRLRAEELGTAVSAFEDDMATLAHALGLSPDAPLPNFVLGLRRQLAAAIGVEEERARRMEELERLSGEVSYDAVRLSSATTVFHPSGRTAVSSRLEADGPLSLCALLKPDGPSTTSGHIC